MSNLIEAVSFIVFLGLDVLDFFLCYLFKFVDRYFGQHWDICYCHSVNPDGHQALYAKQLPDQNGSFEESVNSPSDGAEDIADVYSDLDCLQSILYTRSSMHPENSKELLKKLFESGHWSNPSITLTRRRKFAFPNSKRLQEQMREVEAGSNFGSKRGAAVKGTAYSMNRGKTPSRPSSPFKSAGNVESLQQRKWSDCACDDCSSWERGDGHLFVNTLGNKIQARMVLPPTDMGNSCPTLEGGIDQLQHIPSRDPGVNIVFIHGFLSSSSFWADTLLPHLSGPNRRNLRLFAPDLLGFGRSPKPRDCHYTIADHVSWIESSVLKRFGIGRFHIVAHSMGCTIALALAARNAGNVCTVTLLAPPYVVSPEGVDPSEVFFLECAPRRIWPPLSMGISVMSWYEHTGQVICYLFSLGHRVWEPLISRLLPLLKSGRVPFSFVKDFLRTPHRSSWHALHNTICGGAYLTDPSLDVLELFKIPVKVIHGRKDNVCPFAMSQELVKFHPFVQLLEIPDEDHVSILLGRELQIALEIDRAVSLDFEGRSNDESHWNSRGLSVSSSGV